MIFGILNKNSLTLIIINNLILFFMNFLYFIIIGAIAGWLAGNIMKGGGFGLLINIILGIVGGAVGGWIFGVLGLSSGDGLIGSLVTSVVGAVALLFVAGLFKK